MNGAAQPERGAKGRRILITGGSGFIGTNLVQYYLRDNSVEVRNYDRSTPRDSSHARCWTQGDLLDPVNLRAVMTDFRPTHLVHLAAVTDQAGSSMYDYRINTEGVQVVLSCAASYGGLQRSVLASSRLVCELGEPPSCDFDYYPPNFYGRSKVIGEQLVRAQPAGWGEWVLVRPTAIWGPWGETPYREFFVSLARGTYLHPGNDRVLKHYGYVGNTVYQVDRLLGAPAEHVHGRTFYLADPEPTEVQAFAATIRAAMGLRPPRSAPLALLRVLARAADALTATGIRELPLSADRLRNLRTPMLFDVAEMSDIVGPLPWSLPDGVRQTIAHLRSQGDIPASAGR